MLAIRHIQGATATPVPLEQLSDARSRPGFVWVDIEAPTAQEEAWLGADALGLDPLVLEDIREDQHLPKVDVGVESILLVAHGLKVTEELVEVETIELDAVLGQDLLITFRREPSHAVTRVAQRLDAGQERRVDRPVLLLHRILDVMNDVFIPLLDLVDRRLDLVEEDILEEPMEDTRREIYRLQRDLIQLRRVVVPQAEAMRRLGRDPVGLLDDEDRPLFRDLYDHLYRVAELSRSYQQLLDNAMASYRSALDDELNDMLTTLTMISAVLLPISVIAGIYGTNFEWVPELTWRWSYPVMWAVFVVIVVGQLLWFRSRGWIGDRREREAQRRRALRGVSELRVLGKVMRVPAYGARAVASTGRRVGRLVRRPGS